MGFRRSLLQLSPLGVVADANGESGALAGEDGTDELYSPPPPLLAPSKRRREKRRSKSEVGMRAPARKRRSTRLRCLKGRIQCLF